MLLPWLHRWLLDPYLVAIIVYSLLSLPSLAAEKGRAHIFGIFSFGKTCELLSKRSRAPASPQVMG